MYVAFQNTEGRLSEPKYERFRDEYDGDLPSSSAIKNRLGGVWSISMRKAGLDVKKTTICRECPESRDKCGMDIKECINLAEETGYY